METVLRGWPWLGLAIAVPMLVVMLVRPRAGQPWRARFEDPAWLLWLPLPIYMLHQFEEHGIDALGRAYAFRGVLCTTIGWTGPLEDCPATEWFVFGVNPGTVWIAGLAAGIYGPKRAMVGAAALGIPAINAVAHVVPAIRTHTYNPGLLTALVLFVPLCAWSYRALVRAGSITRARVALGIFSGWLLHAVLLGSLWLSIHGMIGEALLVAIQFANGFLPVAAGYVVRPLPATASLGSSAPAVP